MSHHHDHEHSHGDHHHHHHDHEHGHSHDHTHAQPSETMTFEEKTKKILAHWHKHNADHAKTYADWAEQARANGMDEVGDIIAEVESMTLAINEKFAAALKKLEG